MSSSQRDTSVASTTRATDTGSDKIGKPDYFKGERTKLDDWINQMTIYFALNGITNDQKRTMTGAFYLRGEAQNWIRPKLQKWLIERQDTDGMFSSWEVFVNKIRSIYGLNNDKQVAIRAIQQLTQRTSASAYTAKFKEYSDKTDWDDSALMTMYYRGLKDSVKDEMMRDGAARDTLERMIKAAIRIDDALYERSMEKRHTNSVRGRLGYVPYSRPGGQRRDPDAMEVDNTEKRPKKGRGMKGQKKGSQQPKKEGIRCYNCDKIGHYARDCRSGKMQPPKQREFNAILNPIEPGASASEARGAYDTTGTVKAPPMVHSVLHWSACYKDNCRTHYDAKFNAGWFPSKPRKEVANTERLDEVDECYYGEARDSTILVPHDEFQDKDWELVTETDHTPQVNIIERVPTPGITIDDLRKKEATLQARLNRLEKQYNVFVGDDKYHEELLVVFDNIGHVQARLETTQKQIREYPTQPKKEVREINMIEVRQSRLEEDDGHHARGRSPPPFAWEEEEQPKEQTPSLMMETEEEIQDHLVIESQTTTLGEETEPTSSYEMVDPEVPETESEPETEYSEDEEPDDTEKFTMTIEASSPVLRLATLLSEDAGVVFPVIGGKRRLHPHRFDIMLERMRALMWTYRQVNVEWDASTYVIDRPPIGSKFDPKSGGYQAPDGVAISKPMREWVKITKQRYREIQEIQEKWFTDEINYVEMKEQCIRTTQHGPVVTPDLTLTPIWRGSTLGHIKTTTRGPVRIRLTKGKVIFSSKPGPLQWEVCLENMDSPTYASKNYWDLPLSGASDRN